MASKIIDADNVDQECPRFIRKTEKGDMLVCVFNMAPVGGRTFALVFSGKPFMNGTLE